MKKMQIKAQLILLCIIILCTLAIFTVRMSPLRGFLGKLLREMLDQGFPCHPDPLFKHSNWYNKYSTTVYSVRRPPNCTNCRAKMKEACSRWWHPDPTVFAPYKPRKWSGTLRPKDEILPVCEFGQLLNNKTKCSASHQKLFKALENLRVVYFPRSGSELGIVRSSSYLSDDGDLDIFVDMPQTMLLKKLKKILKPAPHMSGSGSTAEVHWRAFGCPEAHMVYNDFLSLEFDRVARPEDLCSCRLNSVNLLCHRDGVQRMYTQYGPSWRVPLGVKCLDMPYYAITHPNHSWTKSLAEKLKKLINATTDRIEEEAVSVLMKKPLEEEEIPLVLAQLNVIANSLNLLKKS